MYSLYRKMLAELNDLLNKANIYSSWEAKSRYYDGFKETIQNIEECFKTCDILMSYCKEIKKF